MEFVHFFRAGARLPATTSLVALLAAGCATGPTLKRFDVNSAESAVMSADLRAILVMKDVQGRGDNDADSKRTVVCAEPQPDAMRAVAQEFAAAIRARGESRALTGASVGPSTTGEAAFSAAASEALASLGQRTPTIQLMRDALYRACEMVMDGIIARDDLPMIVTRIDNVMLGLHAIDGLTRMPASPSVVIGTGVNGAQAITGGTSQGTGTTVNGTPATPAGVQLIAGTPAASTTAGGGTGTNTSNGGANVAGGTTVRVQPTNVTAQIKDGAAVPSRQDLATVAKEVRKIVGLTLLDRACRLEQPGTRQDKCDQDQKRLIELTFSQ